MAIKLNELEVTGTRWQAPTQDYPQGSFINGTGQGKRDGSYAKAEWANDIFGFHGAILKNGDETPNGQVETAENSQVFNALKKIIKNDIDTLGGDPSAVASGDVNDITATFTKPVSFEGGKLVKVRAIGANTSETVTFNPNGLGAKQIVKGNNDNLSIGDIAGEGFWITLIYDATLDKWVLQNPATGVTLVLPDASTSTKGIIQIATGSDVKNGLDKTKSVTPYDLMQNFVSIVSQSFTEEQKEQIRENINAASADKLTSVPTGVILCFSGTSIPDGFLLCNGANVSRTEYANLFAVIGTKWGSGNGSSTFTLPNFNDRFVEGTTDPNKVGTYMEDGIPNITGGTQLQYPSKIRGFENFTGAFKSNGLYRGGDWGDYGAGGPMGFLFDASMANNKYGSADVVQPRSAFALIIIKT